jgi:hypothetical protein
MFDAVTLNDCLVELPPFGSFPLWSLKNVIEPLRPQKVIDIWLSANFSGSEAPVGFVCSMPNGRQAYVPTDPLKGADIEKAVFLLSPDPGIVAAAYKGGNFLHAQLGEPDRMSPLSQEEKRYARWLYEEDREGVEPFVFKNNAKLG